MALELKEQPVPLKSRKSLKTEPITDKRIAVAFSSTANDYVDVGIDLNEQLIHHPSSTFFLKVSGNSMTGAGIHDGDLLLVDRSLEPRPGKIVVAILNGSFTLKRLERNKGKLILEAAHPEYPPMELHNCGDIQIWGVAIHVIHPL